jgi:MinD-like ATPase involved in chromosome partitioning or flagellar assembly
VRIVTFYSFKGGSGRSVSLANVATVLASRGKNVGIVDFDFEAPGMARIFDVEPDPKKPTLQDFLINPNAGRLRDCVINICDEKNLGVKGRLYLLPASYNWDLTSRVPQGIEAYNNFCDRIVPSFDSQFGLDFLLLDSRSGLSEAGAIALTIPRMIVAFFRLDRQSVYGMSVAMQVLTKLRKPFLLVASNVSSYAQNRKAGAERQLHRAIDFTLPRDERLDVEECILYHEEPTKPICRGYEDIAEVLLKP